jgi:hypothetical protein
MDATFNVPNPEEMLACLRQGRAARSAALFTLLRRLRARLVRHHAHPAVAKTA